MRNLSKPYVRQTVNVYFVFGASCPFFYHSHIYAYNLVIKLNIHLKIEISIVGVGFEVFTAVSV
jgi:hypothetical protein